MRAAWQIVEKSYETLAIALEPAEIIRITLSRPTELNAVNSVMHEEITDVFGSLGAVSDLGAVIVTGAGRAFCAGGDLDMIEAGNSDPGIRLSQTRSAIPLVRNLLAVRCPVISAINGPAVGLGATIALLADISVLARSAWIADPHVKVGLVAGDGGTLIWPQLLGLARAREFLLRGSRVDAERAEKLGLVNYVVDDDRVLSAAREIARELSAGAREAIAGTKLAVNAQLLRQVDEGLGLAVALEAHSWTSADILEGVASLRNRRQPRWPSSRGAWSLDEQSEFS
jgi:enoyl-CoA hydratase